MDQVKVFVGMAIFLSQMATSPGITSVSNSALIAARCKSQREMDPLSIYPHSAGESHPTLFSQSGAFTVKHVVPPLQRLLKESI